jgi:hypothetical protein
LPLSTAQINCSGSDLLFFRKPYVRLVQNEENWSKLGLAIDRVEFARVLDRVREIRNDVMHFDPDGLDDTVRNELQNAKRLLTGISPEPAPRPQ